MRPRTLILLIIILPAAVWGAATGFIWYSLDATFKNVRSRVAHVADMSYRDVRTSVLGPIGLTGITIRPKGYEDVVKIGSVLVHWNEPKEIIPILESFFKKTLPLKLGMSANHISMSLDSDLGDVLTRPANWEWDSPVDLPPSIWGCGDGPLQAADYRALEYEHLNINARLEYVLSPATNTIKFFLRARSPEMMSLSLEGSIPTAGKGMPPLHSILTPRIKIADLSYTVEDESYNKKKVAYCARKTGESPASFVQSQIARISADLTGYNLYPSDELSEAYRRHMTDSERVTVNLTPLEPIEMSNLVNLEPGNFVDWLGLDVVAGDVFLDELFVERKTVAEEDEEEDDAQREETFNPTPFGELGNHLNRLARITTADGKTHYAYIENTAPDRLILTQHLVGGSASFELELADITEVAVLY